MIARRDLLKAAVAIAGWHGVARASTNVEDLAPVLEPIRSLHGMPSLAGAYLRGADVVALGAVGRRRVNASDPVTTDDRFHLGSCTKAMTATLFARLVEEGRVRWQTPLAETLGDQLKKIHPAYREVSVLQLLSHRAGLPEDRKPDTRRWPRIRALTGPLPQQRRDLAGLVLGQAPASEPGSRMEYSNYGYVIAGSIAERITGQSWEDLMRRLIFEPLGMTSAGFGPPGQDQPWGHTATGCQPVASLEKSDNPAVLGPAGTVHSTLADWAKFASLHLLGAQRQPGLLLKAESFEQLHHDHFGQSYALGWVLADRGWAHGQALTHAGSNTMWYAVVWLAPARNAAFLAATNCGSGFPACDAAAAAMIRKFL